MVIPGLVMRSALEICPEKSTISHRNKKLRSYYGQNQVSKYGNNTSHFNPSFSQIEHRGRSSGHFLFACLQHLHPLKDLAFFPFPSALVIVSKIRGRFGRGSGGLTLYIFIIRHPDIYGA